MTKYGNKGTFEQAQGTSSTANAPEAKSNIAEIPTFQGGGPNLRRHAVESRSVLTEQRLEPSMFPEIQIPSLEGVVIEVPSPPPLSEQEIEEAFERLAYESAVRYPRGPGQVVQQGDEVIVDLVGYMGGFLLPMTAHEGMRLIVEPDVFLPGFAAQLIGTPVGQAKMIEVVLPNDFGVEMARGMGAVFAVEVRDAFRLVVPDASDPSLFQRMGLGADLAQTMEGVIALLLDQRARQMAQDAVRITLETLLLRAPFDVSPALVEAEIQNWWRQTEGRFLIEKGLEREDLETSLEGWLDDPTLRTDATFRLKSALFLYAIAKQADLTSDRKELKGFLGEVAGALGIPLDAREKNLSRDFKEREILIDHFVYAKALAYLSEKVTFHYN